MSAPSELTERVVFVEEATATSRVRLVAAGEIDVTLLDGLSAFIERQRQRCRSNEIDENWAE